MQRIASFSVDHDYIVPGIYISRIDGDVTTYDMRTRVPNTGDLMDNATMHSVEHMFATIIRNSEISNDVIYFGPMGCQTGFYFLFDSAQLTDEAAVALLQDVFARAGVFEGPMPGKSPRECGNFANLDMVLARKCCAWYADLIRDWTVEKLVYPEA